jgi:hypothetical protein
MRKRVLTSFILLGLAGGAAAQTAGGPATASPGAMPSNTPLTSSGAVRHPDAGAATPASPAAIGASKPARPLAATARRSAAHSAAATSH